jgi:hypothetical protein
MKFDYTTHKSYEFSFIVIVKNLKLRIWCKYEVTLFNERSIFTTDVANWDVLVVS